MNKFYQDNKPVSTSMWVILLVVSPALLNSLAVRYDAYDEMWFYFRWLGSSLREGYFGDYFPYIVSGYPIGANIQSGTYNVFYLLFSYLFYNSVWSINLFYITSQYVFFFIAYNIARSYSLNKESSVYFSLSIIASGFLVGHTSHYSYHASALGFMLCFLGFRYAMKENIVKSILFCFIGTYHAVTAGYPAILSFGAQVFIIYFLFILIKEKEKRKYLMLSLLGVIVGSIFSIPTIMHFFNQLQFSNRANGLSVEQVMLGDLPYQSLVNFIFPYLWRNFTGLADLTMERFHLIGMSFPLMLFFFYLIIKRAFKNNLYLIVVFSIGLFFTVLSLGDNIVVPSIRQYLAENLFIYRIGRFPSGEHRGFALFCFALITAFAFQHLWLKIDRKKQKILLIIIFIDFVLTMMVPFKVRVGKMHRDLRGFVPPFKITYSQSEQYLLDKPRDCTFLEKPHVRQKHIAPHTFYWEGYTSLKPVRYLEDAKEMNWAICGNSKLWDYKAKTPFDYNLIHYSPSRIEFDLHNDMKDNLLLLWAETNDGLWRIQINGKEVEFIKGKAQLRYFNVSPGFSVIKMIYYGPLSKLWRSF